ncbi:hypothetical protein NUW58_g9521 [Xylaria curta]|uniref:Uncharacterized protein n=1 Tax=Xylaria curta TaxID=42375 RepID=A0ACC1MWF0_9PEZI|nr:hypothetical protein NUW58_g9521 [Xylaria curta]
MKKSRRAEFRRNLIEIVQVLFAIFIFIVFILAFVIQSGGIVLPAWTRTFQGATPELQATYSAALLSVILVITAIIVTAGIYLREEGGRRWGTACEGHGIPVAAAGSRILQVSPKLTCVLYVVDFIDIFKLKASPTAFCCTGILPGELAPQPEDVDDVPERRKTNVLAFDSAI